MRGHGDMGTRGQGEMHGRDAVLPLPKKIEGTRGSVSTIQLGDRCFFRWVILLLQEIGTIYMNQSLA